jgi:hypothetical protein
MDVNWTETELMEALNRNPALRIRPAEMEKLRALAPEKKHKYGAKPGYLDGIYFDSQAEMERYSTLVLLRTAKVIKDFKCHPRYEVGPKITYEADFEVEYFDGHKEIEDVKGVETPAFKMKAKLFRERYPDLILKIIK